MGFRWNKSQDSVEDDSKSVGFMGDALSFSKDWPIWWRYAQNWRCLDFGVSCVEGYQVYCKSGLHCMMFGRIIADRYVMVRVGPEPVTFWGRDFCDHQLMDVRDTKIIYPSVYMALRGLDIPKFHQQVKALDGSVIWI